jgi:hypothetical protein
MFLKPLHATHCHLGHHRKKRKQMKENQMECLTPLCHLKRCKNPQEGKTKRQVEGQVGYALLGLDHQPHQMQLK